MALVMEALRQVHIPNYRGLILRATYPQLEALIATSYEYYPRAFPGAKYNTSEKRWTFPSGARIFFGYMQHEKDKYNYQGKPYDFIAFDELTHFSESQYMYLMSRNRPTGPGTRVYIRSTANPGGTGHGWVKSRFITPAPPMTPIETTYKVDAPDGRVIETTRKRIFVPSTVFDNPALLANDPHYLDTLSMLPDAERDALLYGDWNSFEGQVFRTWRDAPEHYIDRRWTHVIEPFMPPKHWTRFRGFDWGSNKPFAVGWYAADEDGKLYRIRELYGCGDRPNTGIHMPPQEIAEHIREIEDTDPMLKGLPVYGIADPSIFAADRGFSIAELMGRHPSYVSWSPGDNKRIAGWQQCQYRLSFDEQGETMFQVFNTCRHFIRTIPALVYDDKKVEDVDTNLEDHIADEWRYVCMENPISPRLAAAPEPKPVDPFGRNDRPIVFR